MAFMASAKRGGEGAGVARGMRKREVGRLKEARALVSTKQAHERTHARTHRHTLTRTRKREQVLRGTRKGNGALLNKNTEN